MPAWMWLPVSQVYRVGYLPESTYSILYDKVGQDGIGKDKIERQADNDYMRWILPLFGLRPKVVDL